MKIKQARILFVLIVLAIDVLLYLSCGLLPAQVAANFGSGGKVVAFNQRETYCAITTGIGIMLPIIVYILIALLPRINERFIVLPHREYWLTLERRASTLFWLEKFALTIAALISVFWFALHMVNFRASILQPPHYEFWTRLLLLLAWLIFIAAAGIVYSKHFLRIK